MTTHQAHNARIHKKHVPSIKMAKAKFSIPKANYYFQKINFTGVLASACSNYQPQQEKQGQQVGESIVSRSVSLQMSRKMSLGKGEPKFLTQVQSLPKIAKKEKGVDNQIIKSELGCINYYDILKKMEEEQKMLGKSHLTRLSSYVSEDSLLREDHQDTRQEQQQVNYDDYDRKLMEREPLIYQRRLFKLKHKADWCQSTYK